MCRVTCLHVLVSVLLGAILVGVHPPLSAAQTSACTDPPALILLVRHAEKACAKPGDDDPPLTTAGAERAHALATALQDAGVAAIITTELRRTRDTAQPLATALKLSPKVVYIRHEKGAEHVRKVKKAVCQPAHAGRIVLVVGHSDTIPAIIAALDGPRGLNISEWTYSNLFILIPGAKAARLVRLHYGAADPEPYCK